MNGKKLLIAALSSTLLIGAAATASFAAPGDRNGHGRPHRPPVPPEVVYIRMLQEFDSNGDMKISKEEVVAGVDKIFDQIDTNKDGSVTPGELRAYRQERIKAWRAEHEKKTGDKAADTATSGDNAGKPQDQAQNDDQANRPVRGGHGQRQHGMGGASMMRAAMLFQRIDTDENGQISKQEAEAAANRLFDRMDRDHDGVISLADMPSRPFL